jgi:hypothetical protein
LRKLSEFFAEVNGIEAVVPCKNLKLAGNMLFARIKESDLQGTIFYRRHWKKCSG